MNALLLIHRGLMVHVVQVDDARAALELYIGYSIDWEKTIKSGEWPCALPPDTFARCYT
jgi:RNA exonuclease 4